MNDLNLTAFGLSEMPQVDFYIQGGFNYSSKCGYYRLLMMFGEHKKYFEEENLEGSSDVSMILLAVIRGLEMLKKPCEVMVYSNTLFGISMIYKNGRLRESIRKSSANYQLKERVRTTIKANEHVVDNIAEGNLTKHIEAWRKK